MHVLQLYRNVRNTDKLIANMCSIFCPFKNLYYSVNSSLPGKGKCPFILIFFSLLTMIAYVSVNILGKKKEIKLSPTETRETYL